MPDQLWLPNPPDGTAICLGFDGSLNNDWTAIGAETMDGYSFTPRWGPDEVATIWNPAEHGGRIPHSEVHTAFGELFDRFVVVRAYCDPHDWETDIEDLALEHGEEKVVQWPTNQISRMYLAIRRFENDLAQGRIRHDGCPVAAQHVGNAKKVGKPGQMYILGKPNENQKIDVAMTRVVAHEAKSDALAAGWEPPKPRRVRVWRG
ncbi:terminase TerL endonuclease subunit [Herbiconiux sp. KACC 21604]|uniref:terminase TerL endonuclease subunit n=1 Tax=unclassified Herbiconiux TaxID=2618217 RepID=UPI0014908C06|nr:terminase TerL endonuclease subunit [Herbiconiux sp. SALV-R1]QJU54346.1 terminase [Herbiconiux sp. SALV-R1]WPO85416.1 terminase TerL endonuclease subunit [Herbiconiux sp. KACC 21604]